MNSSPVGLSTIGAWKIGTEELLVGGTPLTDRELDIMSVLWRAGSGTVAEVRGALDADLGYTSVLKMLQILEEKGMVRHQAEGRAYRYFPLLAPDQAGGAALRRIVDKIFHGSAEMALARLVSQHRLGADEIARMKDLLDEAATATHATGTHATGTQEEPDGQEEPGSGPSSAVTPDPEQRGLPKTATDPEEGR